MNQLIKCFVAYYVLTGFVSCFASNVLEHAHNGNRMQFKSIYFYTRLDFELMCEWFDAIKSVEDYQFNESDLILTLKSHVTDGDLLELVAIRDRYHLPSDSFNQYMTEQNQYWSSGPKFHSIYPQANKDKKLEADKRSSLVRLECTPLDLYTQLDKNNMFEWIVRNICFVSLVGLGPTVYLYISPEEMTEESLRNLIGLFKRYDFDLQQLLVFKNDENKHWLQNHIDC